MPAHKPPAMRPSNRFLLALSNCIFMTVIRETLSTVQWRVVCTTNVVCSFSTCEFSLQIVLFLTSGPGARRSVIYSATIHTFVHAQLTVLYDHVHAHDSVSTLENQLEIVFLDNLAVTYKKATVLHEYILKPIWTVLF